MNTEKINLLLDKADRLKINGDHFDAIKICEAILAESPKCIQAYEEIGDNYLSLRKFSKAEKALKQASKFDSNSSNAAYLLGFLYSCQREWSLSINALERANELKPNHAEILRCLGWSFFMRGEQIKGIILLERARTLEPKDIYILIDLGVCYLNRKEIKKSLMFFQQVIKFDPENQKARECLLVIEEYKRVKK
jgi:tetratricopeptide (TPR) repeat protein